MNPPPGNRPPDGGQPEDHPIDRLTRLIDRLRGPGGCPWDRAQTPASLAVYLVEEAAEAAQAIAQEGPAAAREELGDLIFQILFILRIFESEGAFGLKEAVEAVEAKMIRRHPHVFGELELKTPAQVKANWDRIKRGENGPGSSILGSVPRGLPGLLRAHRLSQRAAGVGFDWPEAAAVLKKVEEELAELESAQDKKEQAEEAGDLLFAAANLVRHLGINPEEALQAANTKFQRRFERLEEVLRERGEDPAGSSAEAMNEVWEEIKREDRR